MPVKALGEIPCDRRKELSNQNRSKPTFAIVGNYVNVMFPPFICFHWSGRRIIWVLIGSVLFSCCLGPYPKTTVFRKTCVKMCSHIHPKVNQRRFVRRDSLAFIVSDGGICREWEVCSGNIQAGRWQERPKMRGRIHNQNQFAIQRGFLERKRPKNSKFYRITWSLPLEVFPVWIRRMQLEKAVLGDRSLNTSLMQMPFRSCVLRASMGSDPFLFSYSSISHWIKGYW
jgi:hypothetical protein